VNTNSLKACHCFLRVAAVKDNYDMTITCFQFDAC